MIEKMGNKVDGKARETHSVGGLEKLVVRGAPQMGRHADTKLLWVHVVFGRMTCDNSQQSEQPQQDGTVVAMNSLVEQRNSPLACLAQ